MFEINTGLIFWTTVSFVVMVIILYKIAFPPLNRVLEQRRSSIEGRLEQAKKAQAEAEGLLAKYRSQLADAEKKTRALFAEAEKKSQAYRDDAMKSAQKESYRIIEGAKKDLDIYKRQALSGLKEDISNIVVEVSGRLIKKKLIGREQLRMVEASIRELAKHAKKQS